MPRVTTAKPPIADLTVQERVLQAVTRTYELVAERTVAVADLQAAKQNEDKVRLGTSVATAKQEAASVRDAALGGAEEAFRAVMDVELAELQRVQARYDLILSQNEEKRTAVRAKSPAAHDKVVEQAQQEYNMNMATAHATVFRGEKEIVAIQTTIDQHKRQVQEHFGIDIGKLVV